MMKIIYKNPFAAMRSVWNIEAFCGYEPQTTFWSDFSIADCYGEKAVRDTFKRAFEEWKSNIVYLTELSLVLNHKTWQHHNVGDEEGSEIYKKLWKKVDEYAYENLSGEDADYYFRITD